MKKIIMFFLILFMFIASPVNASSIDDYNNEVHYKLEKESKKDDSSIGGAFWGMLAVAFLAISVFIIAYKSDDGTPDD